VPDGRLFRWRISVLPGGVLSYGPPAGTRRLLRHRLTDAVARFLDRCQLTDIALQIQAGQAGADTTARTDGQTNDSEPVSIADRASHHAPTDPEYTFDFIVRPEQATPPGIAVRASGGGRPRRRARVRLAVSPPAAGGPGRREGPGGDRFTVTHDFAVHHQVDRVTVADAPACQWSVE